MWLARQNLRYDITVMPPSVVCGEYVKTKGHYHPENRRGVRYPEIYEVLGGSAEYILQDIQIKDVVVVSAKYRDLVLIPPGYGHVTINPSDQTLVMANIVSDAFMSAYDGYEKFHGAVYYRMAGDGYVKNHNYPDVPPLRRRYSCNLREFPRLGKMSLYDLIGDEEALRFLNHPEDYSFGNILED
jgi:glucose-6-phosphate isomerase